MKIRLSKFESKYNKIVIVAFLAACNSINHETNALSDSQKKDQITFLFQDTSIKRYLFEGGYEGVILESYREENLMFPYRTSHARLKVSLTQDSTFIVNYLFFKSTPAAPDTVVYFLRRDYPENSYYLKKELRGKEKIVKTKIALEYGGRQVIQIDNKNYEIFKFKSKGSLGISLHTWLPDIGIIKLESEEYDKSFVLSFASDDFRTKLIKDILRKAH